MPTKIARHAGFAAVLGFALIALVLSAAFSGCAAQKALPQYTPEQQAAQRGGISYWQPNSAKAVPQFSPVAQAKLEARRRRGQAPAPLASDGGVRSLDSLVAIPYATPQPGRSTPFWQKVNPFRSKPAQHSSSAAQHSTNAAGNIAQVPRKCKGCTFNVVAGNQTVAGKKAQVAAGDGATASVIGKKAGPAQVASDSSTQNALLGGGNLAAVHGDGNTLPQTATTQQAADWRATLAKPAGYVLAALGTVAIVGGCIFLIAAYRRRNLLNNNG